MIQPKNTFIQPACEFQENLHVRGDVLPFPLAFEYTAAYHKNCRNNGNHTLIDWIFEAGLCKSTIIQKRGEMQPNVL